MLIGFVQLELPGLIGLADGRYVERLAEDERVMIVQALGAPKPGGKLRRRPRPVQSPDREEVPFTRVTVTRPGRFDDPEAAKAWLRDTADDNPVLREELRSAVRTIRLALDAQRAAAEDPLIAEVGLTRALCVRIGYGEGDLVADGRWKEARELPAAPGKRLGSVEPSARVAAVLAGRETVSPAEVLLARVRLDLEADRPREAALTLPAVLRVLAAAGGLAAAGAAELVAPAEAYAERALTAELGESEVGELSRLVAATRKLLLG